MHVHLHCTVCVHMHYVICCENNRHAESLEVYNFAYMKLTQRALIRGSRAVS
jgi:hypothetical protein